MTLNGLVEEIINKLDRYSIQECLQDIGENVMAFLKAETCLFFLLNSNQNELSIAKAVGRPALKDEHLRLPIGHGIAGHVAANMKPLLFNDINTNEDELLALGAGGLRYFPEVRGKCRAVIAVPLVAFGVLIGVLEILDPKPRAFKEKDLEVLQPLVNIAAIAIPRTKVNSSLVKLAEISVRFLEEKDQYTHGHSIRVMRYSLLLADELQLPEDVRDDLQICSLLHDIGKVILKDSILSKKGKLTRSEFDTVKMHPSIGSNITGKISRSMAAKILSHHERFDGTGYPGGLKGRRIPIISRIIAIADAFDAITSTRPYREQESIEAAIEEIRLHSGTQFDPVLVSAFRRLYHKGKLIVEHI
jgi:HD-GYP domain-containing protein (c-di-GMP phosphodiesterase class II)